MTSSRWNRPGVSGRSSTLRPDRYHRVVPTPTLTAPGFGTGIYSFPEAARILALRSSGHGPRALRRWAAGLAEPGVGLGPTEVRLLSFHDLVSLEVVRRFRQAGVSLQRVRKLEIALAESLPLIARPFAHRRFFTDGASIWADLAPTGTEPQVVELGGIQDKDYVWLPVIGTFAEEIRFGDENEAAAWELTDRIEIDPSVQFGEPVVKGTRLPVAVIARELASHKAEQIADWHAIDVEDVRDVRQLLAL